MSAPHSEPMQAQNPLLTDHPVSDHVGHEINPPHSSPLPTSKTLTQVRRVVDIHDQLLTSKTVGYVGGICLLVNAMTGPSIPFTAGIYASGGFILPTLCFLLFSMLATLSGLFIVEAMQAIPGNKHFQGTVEFATLVNFYFGKKMHWFAQFCLYGALQSNAIQSIVLSAQTIDNILIDLFGRSCAVSLQPASWLCVAERSESGSPFGNTWILFSIGLLIVFVLIVPMGMSSLDDNIVMQIIAFSISLFIMLQWIIASFIYKSQNEGPQVPLINANGLQNMIGTIMLSIASTYVVPSFVNLRKKEVSIQKTMWTASFLTTAVYIAIGIFPAISFTLSEASGGNVLPALSLFGQPGMLTKITVYAFPLVMLLPNIPVCFIVSRSNLIQNGLFRKEMATLVTFILPPLFAIPLLSNPSAMAQFLSFTSLMFVSTSNFIIPIVIYLKCCTFRHAYNVDRGVLTPNQRHLLKLIHFRNKKVIKWVEYKGWSGLHSPPMQGQAMSEADAPSVASQEDIMLDDQGRAIGVCMPLQQGHFELLNQNTTMSAPSSPWTRRRHRNPSYPLIKKMSLGADHPSSRHTTTDASIPVSRLGSSHSPSLSLLPSPVIQVEKAPSISLPNMESDIPSQSNLLQVVVEPGTKSRSSSVRTHTSSVRFQLPDQQDHEPVMDKGKNKVTEDAPPLLAPPQFFGADIPRYASPDSFASSHRTSDDAASTKETSDQSSTTSDRKADAPPILTSPDALAVPMFSFRVRSPTAEDGCFQVSENNMNENFLQVQLDPHYRYRSDSMPGSSNAQPTPAILVTTPNQHHQFDITESEFMASSSHNEQHDHPPTEQVFLETENLMDDETFRNQAFTLRRGFKYIPDDIHEKQSFKSEVYANHDVESVSDKHYATFADEPYLIEDVPDPDAEDLLYEQQKKRKKHVTVYGVHYEEDDEDQESIVAKKRHEFQQSFHDKIEKWERDVAHHQDVDGVEMTTLQRNESTQEHHNTTLTVQSMSSLNLLPNSLTLIRPGVPLTSPSILSFDFHPSPESHRENIECNTALEPHSGELKLFKSGYSSVLGVPIYSRSPQLYDTHPPVYSRRPSNSRSHHYHSEEDPHEQTVGSSAGVSLFQKSGGLDLRKRAGLKYIQKKRSVESLYTSHSALLPQETVSPHSHMEKPSDDKMKPSPRTESLHPKSIQTTRSYASSLLSFTQLENMNPLFFKTMTLPVHPEYVGIAFRTLPRWLTQHIRAQYVAMACLLFTLVITVASIVNLLQQTARS